MKDDIDKLKRTLGAALLGARERAGLTQADVASKVGIASAVYGRIERGQMLPSVPTMRQLCVTLGIGSDVLMGLGPEDLAAVPPATAPGDPPELRRLAGILRTLPRSSLRVLMAIASVIRR